jgi:hypothetical protein
LVDWQRWAILKARLATIGFCLEWRNETTISFNHYLDGTMRQQYAALLKGAQTSIISLATRIVDDYYGRQTT